MGIMENTIGTIVISWDNMGIVENNIVYRSYIGIVQKKIETTV